jgi:23S rRNA (uridine2552-2'-O)-methyltransferase
VARSKTSRSWMQRHVADPFVRRARAEGYRSRAAFKLLEIAARDRLFAAGQVVVDLGAAPGGWSQVVAEHTGPGGRVVAIDLLDMAPLPGVTFVRGDFTAETVRRELERVLGGRPVDLVLSDLSPNLSGVAATDSARSIALAEDAVEFAAAHLRRDGALLVKTFQGAGFPALLRLVRERFAQVASRKPEASRARSSEMYLLARGPRQKS